VAAGATFEETASLMRKAIPRTIAEYIIAA
jgi:hypothetical protein